MTLGFIVCRPDGTVRPGDIAGSYNSVDQAVMSAQFQVQKTAETLYVVEQVPNPSVNDRVLQKHVRARIAGQIVDPGQVLITTNRWERGDTSSPGLPGTANDGRVQVPTRRGRRMVR